MGLRFVLGFVQNGKNCFLVFTEGVFIITNIQSVSSFLRKNIILLLPIYFSQSRITILFNKIGLFETIFRKLAATDYAHDFNM